MRPHRRRKRHSQQYSNLIHEAVMPHSNRIKLSLAGTAAVALASLPLAISPASAAKVSQESISTIGVIEASSDAQQFNLANFGVQGSSTGLVPRRGVSSQSVLLQVCSFFNLRGVFGIPFCK